jgi:hypothetical protein
MVQRSAPQQVVAEPYFPVRVRVAVPTGGSGSQFQRDVRVARSACRQERPTSSEIWVSASSSARRGASRSPRSAVPTEKSLARTSSSLARGTDGLFVMRDEVL